MPDFFKDMAKKAAKHFAPALKKQKPKRQPPKASKTGRFAPGKSTTNLFDDKKGKGPGGGRRQLVPDELLKVRR